jgi:hypothetical protein
MSDLPRYEHLRLRKREGVGWRPTGWYEVLAEAPTAIRARKVNRNGVQRGNREVLIPIADIWEREDCIWVDGRLDTPPVTEEDLRWAADRMGDFLSGRPVAYEHRGRPTCRSL